MMVMSSKIGVIIVIKCIYSREENFLVFDLSKGNLIKPSLCQRKNEIEIIIILFFLFLYDTIVTEIAIKVENLA